MKEKTTDFAVGIFVMAGLILLAVMIVKFGDFNYARKMYELTAVFKFTNGVVVGAPVRCAGVQVGKVRALRFTEDKEFGVDVVMDVKQGTVIRKDARVVINSLGIMGEKYVEFLPQSITAPVLSSGDSIRGQDPVAFSEIMQEGSDIAKQIEQVVKDFQDSEIPEKIRNTIANIEQLTDEETQTHLKGILGNVNDITGSPNKENITLAIERFKEFSESANSVSVRLDNILKDNEPYFKTIGKDIAETVASMKVITGKIEKGEGTVGQLIKDKEIGKDIKDFVKDIKANPWKLFFKGPEKRIRRNDGEIIEVKEEKGKFLGIF